MIAIIVEERLRSPMPKKPKKPKNQKIAEKTPQSF
jgi:hypothetical protein